MLNYDNFDNFDRYNFTPIEIFMGYSSVSAQLDMVEISSGVKYSLNLRSIVTTHNTAIGRDALLSNIIDQAHINLALIFSYIDKYKIKALKITKVLFLSHLWEYLGILIKQSKSIKYLWFDESRLYSLLYEPIIYDIFSSKILAFLWTNTEIHEAERNFAINCKKYLHNLILLDSRVEISDIIINYDMNTKLYNDTLHAIYLLLMTNKRRNGIIGRLPKDVLLLILKDVWETYRD